MVCGRIAYGFRMHFVRRRQAVRLVEVEDEFDAGCGLRLDCMHLGFGPPNTVMGGADHGRTRREK